MFTWKKVLISATIAQAAKTITSPTKAAVIWFLAASVWALSPPEAIQRIPPITKMKKKTIAAITTARRIRAETIPATVIPPSCSKPLLGAGVKLIVSASSLCMYLYYWITSLLMSRVSIEIPKKF